MTENEKPISNQEVYTALSVLKRICKQADKCDQCMFGFYNGNGTVLCHLRNNVPEAWELQEPVEYRPIKMPT